MRFRRGQRVHALPAREDVERELGFHIEMRVQELIAEGWERTAAHAEAVRAFGDMSSLRKECVEITERHERTARRGNMLAELRQDISYALRGLRSAPGFALIAVLTLGLGIGANTAAFTLVNGVVLRSLPYPEPERLVGVWEMTQRNTQNTVSYANLRDWQQRSRSFTALGGHNRPSQTTVLGAGEALRAGAVLVTREFFPVMGVQPMRGRLFLAEEQQLNGSPAVVVSEGFWRQHLNAAEDLTGVRLQLYGYSANVVGVMPASFSHPPDVDLWMPAELLEGWGDRTAHNFLAVGRLAPGVNIAAARGEMDALAKTIMAEDANNDAFGADVVDLREQLVGNSKRGLMLLLAASSLVLLVACSNLASTLLARGTSRQREYVIRAALGARALRLVRQSLTESVLLALLGGALGVLLAAGVLRGLVVLAADAIPRLDAVALDLPVLAFAFAISFATAIAFGMAPALRAAAVQPAAALQETSRGGSAGPRRQKTWSLLIGVEVALAVVLLVGAGLLIRSLGRVLNTETGFDAEGVVTTPVALSSIEYPEIEQRKMFYDQLLPQIDAIPAVQSVGMINSLPFVGFNLNGGIGIDGESPDGSPGYRIVGGDYFGTLRIPLLRGRLFGPEDTRDGVPVAVINSTMAERYFPGGNALGSRFTTGGMDSEGSTPVTVVGIVGDVRHISLLSAPAAEYYLPYQQRPQRIGSMTLVARTGGDPAALYNPMRSVIRAANPDIPIEFARFDRQIASTVGDRRLTMIVLAAFSTIALLLSAIGIYGVVSYAVAQRTREIGIRIALGAAPMQIIKTILAGTMGVVALGLTAGVIAALMLSRTLQSMLHEVSPLDPLTFGSVVLLLLATATAAVVVPASRTTRVDPLNAIKE